MSKRDREGLLKATPTLSYFAAPIPEGLCSVLNSAPPRARCSGPPRSGHPRKLGCKCDMEYKTARRWTGGKTKENGNIAAGTPLLNSELLL